MLAWERLRWPSKASLVFSAHTTAAALLALVIAQAIALEHPWWAAMTVWLVAQPTRGLLIERIGARLLGTAVGAAVGEALLAALFDHPVALMIALAFWVGTCAGVGSLFRHFRNYGFVLAGYTAAIVALFGLGDASFDVDLAVGRIGCTVIGVLASGLLSWGFTAKSASLQLLQARIGALVDASVRYSIDCLRSNRSEAQALDAVLQEIAALGPFLDQVAAGSRSLRARALRARGTIAAVVDLLVITVHLTPHEHRCARSAPANAAQPLPEDLHAVLIDAARHPDIFPARYLEKLSRVVDSSAFFLSDAPEPAPLANERDWRAARIASARPLTAMAIATTAWWSLGWSDGPVMVMTAVLFASLFSNHSHGNAALEDVLTGSAAGAVLGLACRFWLLPHVEATWQLAVVAPFLLLGAWLMARPGTAKMAIDLNMTFLLIAQPALHTDTGLEHSLLQMLAILAGVLIAVLTYRWILPSSPQADRERLAQSLARLVLNLADAPMLGLEARIHIQITGLLVKLIAVERRGSALLMAAFECASVAQAATARSMQKLPTSSMDRRLALLAAADLESKTAAALNYSE